MTENPCPDLSRAGHTNAELAASKLGGGNKRMSTRRKLPAAAAVLVLLGVQPAPAYEHPLDTHSIREAYFLGNRKDEKATKFLAHYAKQLPLPKKGPHVAEIELLTPYAQVVLRAYKTPGSYSAQGAEQDYAAHPDLIRVRVRINLTPTYPGYTTDSSVGKGAARERSPDFWRDFRIELTQGKTIAPKKVSGTPVYASAFHALPPLAGPLQGAEVWLEYDTSKIDSAPVRIEVSTPDGQTVEAEFDLKDLR